MHNILIFGDSISAGKGVKKENSWPVLLSGHFDNKCRYSTLVHNLSFSSESTKEVMKRFSSEVGSRFRKRDELSIIFAVGINDAKCIKKKTNVNIKEKTFTDNILLLAKQALKYTNNIVFYWPFFC